MYGAVWVSVQGREITFHQLRGSSPRHSTMLRLVGSSNSHDGDSRTSMCGGAQPTINIMKYLLYILLAICVVGTITFVCNARYLDAVVGMWIVILDCLLIWIERRERDEQ